MGESNPEYTHLEYEVLRYIRPDESRSWVPLDGIWLAVERDRVIHTREQAREVLNLAQRRHPEDSFKVMERLTTRREVNV